MCLLVCGVDGFINATANFAPEYTVNTYQSAKRGDFNEAAKWFNKMVEAMDIYAYSTPLFLACKQAMYYRVLHHDGQERPVSYTHLFRGENITDENCICYAGGWKQPPFWE